MVLKCHNQENWQESIWNRREGPTRGILQYKELIVFILLEIAHTFITEYSHLELIYTKVSE